MPEKTNFSLEEAASWLGVAPRTVYRLVQRGRLPGFKVGRQWRFSPEMLEAWRADRVTAEWLKVEHEEAHPRKPGSVKHSRRS